MLLKRWTRFSQRYVSEYWSTEELRISRMHDEFVEEFSFRIDLLEFSFRIDRFD